MQNQTYASVSHVSIITSEIGVPFESETVPSTHIYSPFPSEAIDSPRATEHKQKCQLERVIFGRWLRCRVLTIIRIFREKWSKHATFRCVSERWVVQGVHKCRDAKNVRKQDELLTNIRTRLADPCQKLNSRHPFFCRKTVTYQFSISILNLCGTYFVS